MNDKIVIEGIKKGVVNTMNSKANAEQGCFIQNGAGTVPDGNYYGFEFGDDGATITSIDFGENTPLYQFSTGTTLVDFPFANNVAYFFKFKSMVISAGNVICYKS